MRNSYSPDSGGIIETRPTDAEFVRLDLLGERGVGAEVEINVRIDAAQHFLIVADIPPGEIVRREAAFIAPLRWIAEAADEIGDGIAILPHGQPRQIDAGRPGPLAGNGGIKAGMHVRGDGRRILFRQRAGVVLRHRVADQFRELTHGQIARERLGVFLRPFAVRPVAAGTLRFVKRSPVRRSRRRRSKSQCDRETSWQATE